MKKKSLRQRRGLTFLKVHALLFALFEFGMALNILVTVNHPLNTNVSFENFRMMVMQSLIISLMWAALFITHLGMHQFRAARKDRMQTEHHEAVENIRERYESTARLDMDVQGVDDDDIIDEEIPEGAYYETQRMKSRS